MIELTVVVPTIGRETLGRTIHSLEHQILPVDYVIVSDAERTGAGPTMNQAIRAVDTPWVGFVADDDRLDITYASGFFHENPGADLFVYRMRYADGRVIPVYGNDDVRSWVFGDVGGSFIMRTELAREIPYVTEDRSRSFCEDWEMVRAVRDRGGLIHVSGRIGYYIRH